MIDPTKQAPIIVLTGFLGAGKSTLLRRLLALPAFSDSALVINEFGDIAIDHELVAAGLPEMAVTSTGCICCTAGGDIRASVSEVHEAARTLGRLPLPRIIVETTGLADPAPVVNQLVAGAVPALAMRDHVVARNYRLAGVVTLFDASAGLDLLSRHPECVKQVAFADTIILTKLDLLDGTTRDDRVADVKHHLSQINPTATILELTEALSDLSAVFAPRPYAPRDIGNTIEPWLGGSHHAHHHHDHHHSHDHHAHSHDEPHDGVFGVGSFSLVRDTPVDREALIHGIDFLQMFYGAHLLRLKGVFAFKDEPDTPYILQVVQHVVHPLAQLDAWPSDDRRTRVVVITFGIDPRKVEDLLKTYLDGDFSANLVTQRQSTPL